MTTTATPLLEPEIDPIVVIRDIGNDLNYTPKIPEKGLDLRSNFVYLMYCEGFVKIGVAAYPRNRLATLQIGNPFPIEILRSEFCRRAYQAETQLHKSFQPFHKRGEWFQLTDELLQKFEETITAFNL